MFVSVCSIPGFGGKVLTEVFHNVEGINRGSSKDASSCLETKIYKRRRLWIGGQKNGKEASGQNEKRGTGDTRRYREREIQRQSFKKIIYVYAVNEH